MSPAKTQELSNTLGIDFGETNIGLALGNNGLVNPLKIIRAKDINGAMYEINRIVVENKIKNLVIGIPLSSEGKETKESLKIRKFAKTLKTVTKRPVVFQNEFGTSKNALREAIDLDTSKKKRRSNDHLAAALILKMYYNDLESKK
ncbi:Holliday junction resolvase RuvX [Patescibacteria group bacterium]|nr:Holliday junction resolvase RuvX [Patescibacteria group bacterium]